MQLIDGVDELGEQSVLIGQCFYGQSLVVNPALQFRRDQAVVDVLPELGHQDIPNSRLDFQVHNRREGVYAAQHHQVLANILEYILLNRIIGYSVL